MSASRSQSNGVSKEVMTAAWVIALGAIAPMLDSTMINIAIKQLNHTFNSPLDVVQWGITGYVLALAIAVPFSGWLMNQFNGKKVFILAMIAFGFTSILAGVSWNITVFNIFRILQGFSAGIITTLMFTLLVKTAGQDHIGKVMAVVSMPMIFGPILGPVLGGFIIHFANWRWIFFINIFIVIIAVPLMNKYVPQFKPFNKESKLDIIGIILLSLTSVSIIYGVTKASDYGTFFAMQPMMYIIIGIVLMIAYCIYNRMRHYRTVLPITLFKQKNYAASSIGLLLANIGIMGPMLIIPLFFQNFKHYTAIEAALALIPQGLGMLITRPYIGKTIDQIGAKYVVIVSIAIAMFGTIPLMFVSDHTHIVWLSIILFIRGCSVGGINLGLTSDAYQGLDDKQIAEAGVGINMIENIGSSLGTAIIATVVASMLAFNHPSIFQSLKAYHAGFLVSVVALLLIVLPALFLTHKANQIES